MKKASKLTALALASLMILSGCGAKTGKDSKDSGKKEESGFKPTPVVEKETPKPAPVTAYQATDMPMKRSRKK